MTKEEKQTISSLIDQLAACSFNFGRNHRLAQIEENPDRESEIYLKFLEKALKTKLEILNKIGE